MQIRQDLGLADHVWSDKRKSIAKSVDNLGDQFRPAMRAVWLSYIRRVYREEEGGPMSALLWEKTPSCQVSGPGLSLRR